MFTSEQLLDLNVKYHEVQSKLQVLCVSLDHMMGLGSELGNGADVGDLLNGVQSVLKDVRRDLDPMADVFLFAGRLVEQKE